MHAEKLLINGHFYTMDTSTPRAPALVSAGDQIVALGDAIELREQFPTAEVLDLGGRVVLPGLTDAHIHFLGYALGLQKIDLYEVPSLQEALDRVAARAAEVPPGTWIQGHGWTQEVWPERAFPSAADLDRVAPHHPVVLAHKSWHSCWVNSQALAVAGITADTPDPKGGAIQRDADGAPTGILLEMSAMDLIEDHVPSPSANEIDVALTAAFPTAWRLGLTGVHDCDGRDALHAYQRLHQRDALGIRIHKHIRAEALDEAITVGLRSGLGDAQLRLGHVKLFADGALGSRTAWMLAPYEGRPNDRGIPIYPPEELADMVYRAAQAGLACAIHAIGDRANRVVLDAFERVQGAPLPLPQRIEHVQLLHPDDLPRLAEMGIVASMQPIHAPQDMEIAERYWGTRAMLSYAWRALLNSGAVLAFGSDCPVETMNPFVGIHAAVTRRRADGAPGPDGWHPEQRLTVAQAVYAYTMGAAHAAGLTHRLGSLSPGKLADLVVLDRDIFKVAPDEIAETRPLGTMIGGRWVYRDAALS